jgi:FtsH-binding integral membrane protein
MAQNQAADRPPLLKEDGTLKYPTQDDAGEEVSMSEAKRRYRQSLIGQFDFREKVTDQVNYSRKVLAIVTAEFLLTGLLAWLCSWSSLFAGLLANKLIGWVAFFALIPLVVLIFFKDDLRK